MQRRREPAQHHTTIAPHSAHLHHTVLLSYVCVDNMYQLYDPLPKDTDAWMMSHSSWMKPTFKQTGVHSARAGMHSQTSGDPTTVAPRATSHSLSGKGWPHTGHSSSLPPAPAEPSAHLESDIAVQGLAVLECMGKELFHWSMHPLGTPLHCRRPSLVPLAAWVSSPWRRTTVHIWLHGCSSECSSAHSTIHQPAALILCSHHLTLYSLHYY